MLASLVSPTLAQAQDEAAMPVEPYVAEGSFSVGHLDLDNDFDDRTIATTNLALRHPNGIGAHVELVGETREEDALFGALGLSYLTSSYSVRGSLGSSSENEGILPQFFALVQASYISPPEQGFIISPYATYRSYRNTAEETVVGTSLTKYFDLPEDQLIIGQLFGAGVLAEPGSNVGYSFGGSAAYGRYDRWQAGLLLEAGDSRYDSVLGAGGVSNDFVSARPFASLRVADNIELFSRLEYYDTDFYDAVGGFLGIKITTTIDRDLPVARKGAL